MQLVFGNSNSSEVQEKIIYSMQFLKTPVSRFPISPATNSVIIRPLVSIKILLCKYRSVGSWALALGKCLKNLNVKNSMGFFSNVIA